MRRWCKARRARRLDDLRNVLTDAGLGMGLMEAPPMPSAPLTALPVPVPVPAQAANMYPQVGSCSISATEKLRNQIMKNYVG